MPPSLDSSGLTDDAVLGGRLRLLQPRKGHHRFGHDAVLLAAATVARAGNLVVDLGAGVGAAGLVLAARVAGVRVTLVEVEDELVALAAENAHRNDLGDRVRTVALDVSAPPRAFAAAGLAAGSADAVIMNPPFNDPAKQQMSPHARRRRAHGGAPAILADWARTAARLLRADGTLTLIWRADGLADVIAGLAPAFGSLAVRPVHGTAGAPAIRVLVQARKGGRTPLALSPGLTLNDSRGRPTPEAEAILRRGDDLPFNTL